MINFRTIVPLFGVLFIACSTNEKIETDTETSTILSESVQVDDSIYVYEEYLGDKLNPIRAYVEESDAVNDGEWSLVMDKTLKLDTDSVTATIYIRNNELKKVKVLSNDPAKQGESYYYFKNNEILYVYEQSMEELGSDGILLVKTKSYFEDEILIRSLNNQDCGAPYSKEFREEEQKRIMADLELIRAAFQ